MKRVSKWIVMSGLVLLVGMANAENAKADGHFCSDLSVSVSPLRGFDHIRGQKVRVSTNVRPSARNRHNKASIQVYIEYDYQDHTGRTGTSSAIIGVFPDRLYAHWGRFSQAKWVHTIGPVSDVWVTNAKCVSY